jgi:hypothetical protein
MGNVNYNEVVYIHIQVYYRVVRGCHLGWDFSQFGAMLFGLRFHQTGKSPIKDGNLEPLYTISNTIQT